MNKLKETRGFSNFGFTTILLSFVMICVVTFSALSLVTANSDYKLSRKVAEKTQSFYAAQEVAYDTLISLNSILAQCYVQTTDANSYYTAAAEILKPYGMIEYDSGGYYLSFEEPIADNRYLAVKLQICYPESGTDTFIKIVNWKSVYTQDIPEEEFLNLIE